MDAREHAEKSVQYFARIIQKNNQEVWQKGLNTAQEWLRLIDEENPGPDELSAFLGVIHANRYRTSGWFGLARGAYNWVNTKGIPIPPPEQFFSSEGIPRGNYQTIPSLKYAQTLANFFEQYNREDPQNKAWSVGLEIVREWQTLCETPEVREAEASVLIKKVVENSEKYLSKLWFDTSLGISFWCKATGNLHLLPDNLRNLVDHRKK